MNKLLFITSISLSLSAMGCSSEAEKNNTDTTVTQTEVVAPQTTIKKDVTVDEFSKLIVKEDAQIVDVRTPEEWAEGTVKGAVKINFYATNFKTKLEQLDKTKPVYVYCKAGGRSGQAAVQMQAMGFTETYNLLGGMDAWKSSGKEVVK